MKLTLTAKKEIAKGTMAFWFEKEKALTWKPGQHLHIVLPFLEFEDERGKMRPFSIASSPTEGGLLMFATRIRDTSGFKQTLKDLEIGDTITGDNEAGGNFFLKTKKESPQVILAGGIGITPFRSIIKYDMDKKIGNEIHLIFSNTNSETTPFKEELDNWAKENKRLTVTYVFSEKEGRIDRQKLEKLVRNIPSPDFLIAGPSSFVSSMEEILESMGVQEDKVATEKFSGY